MWVTSVIAYWTHVQMVMWSNAGTVKFLLLFHIHAMLLFYTVDRTICKKGVFFEEIYYHTSFHVPILGGTSALPPQKFMCKPRWYYHLQEIKKYFVGWHPVVKCAYKIIKIHSPMLQLKHVDRQMDWQMLSALCVFILWTLCKECKTTNKLSLMLLHKYINLQASVFWRNHVTVLCIPWQL